MADVPLFKTKKATAMPNLSALTLFGLCSCAGFLKKWHICHLPPPHTFEFIRFFYEIYFMYFWLQLIYQKYSFLQYCYLKKILCIITLRVWKYQKTNFYVWIFLSNNVSASNLSSATRVQQE